MALRARLGLRVNLVKMALMERMDPQVNLDLMVKMALAKLGHLVRLVNRALRAAMESMVRMARTVKMASRSLLSRSQSDLSRTTARRRSLGRLTSSAPRKSEMAALRHHRLASSLFDTKPQSRYTRQLSYQYSLRYAR